jgi:hypothetical protein
VRCNAAKSYHIETAIYSLLALAAVSFVFYLFYFDPVNYTRLLTDDQIGEYSTSVGFALSALMLMALSSRKGPLLRRVMWAIMGLIALFIAGDEISWGQRIFHLSTPEALRQINVQGEITFHNIEAIDPIDTAMILAYLVLAWSVFSVVVSTRMPVLESKLLTIGLPLIPIQLIAMFLSVPFFYFFTNKPIAQEGEIGEIFFGIAVTLWSIDLFLRYAWIKRVEGLPAVSIKFGMLFLVAVLSAILTQSHSDPGLIGWRLNFTAMRDYASVGMYDQAQQLYEYIYAHPNYLSPDTRINHGRMLLKMGRKKEAFLVLSDAARELQALDPSSALRTDNLRRLGIIFMLWEQTDRAETEFNRAIEVDQRQLELESNPDKRAELLWSIAKTLEARGDRAKAVEKGNEARATATSPSIRLEISYWMGNLQQAPVSGH